MPCGCFRLARPICLPLGAFSKMTPKPLHILCLPSWYPTFEKPVVGNFVERHVRAIALEHRVTLIQFLPAKTAKEADNIMAGTEKNVQQIQIFLSDWRIMHRIKMMMEAFRFVRLQPRDFDVVHCHVSLPAGVLALWLHFRYRLPIVLTEHWTIFQPERWKELPLSKRLLLKVLLWRTAAACPVSLQLGKEMQRHWGGLKLRPIPNVVHTHRFFPGPVEKQHRGYRFLHISSLLDSHKNISGMLRAYALLAVENPDVHLTIAGDGDTRRVTQLAMKLQIEPHHLDIFDERTEHWIAQRMRESDALVMFSNFENLPCVILEAMCCGLPVISTDVGGISEHVSPERGLLVARGDEQALLEAMRQLAEGRFQFDRKACASYGLKHFSPETICRLYGEVYEEVRG